MKNPKHYSVWSRFVIQCLLLIPIAILLESGDSSAAQQGKRLFIVMVDETDSFGSYNGKGALDSLYWQEAILLTKVVVKQLASGDEFCLIGIDEQGFDEEDVRIPFEQLDEGFLKAKMQQSALAKKVLALQRRKSKHKSTDILGALYHAADFASKDADYKTIIICLSDMKQEPTWPSPNEASNLKFPTGTQAFFFYVDASGRNNYQKIVSVWEPILSKAGLNIHTDNTLNFYQRGESMLRLGRVLQKL